MFGGFQHVVQTARRTSAFGDESHSVNPTMQIHPTAVVSPDAQLGVGVRIDAYAVVEAGAVVGDHCHIGPHVTIYGSARLGRGCQVHHGAALGGEPQDLSFRGGETFVEIGAGCQIREYVTVHRATRPAGVTRLGEECLLMANSHVGHDAVLGRKVILTNGVLLAGHCQVGDQAVLSGNCMVHQFTRIGRLAMLSGGSAVQMDVPPFCMTRSLSSNTVMSLNVVGLRRGGLQPADRRVLKDAFHVLYRSGKTTPAALEILSTSDHPLVRELCEFIRSSKRGICRFIHESDADSTDEPPQLQLVA